MQICGCGYEMMCCWGSDTPLGQRPGELLVARQLLLLRRRVPRGLRGPCGPRGAPVGPAEPLWAPASSWPFRRRASRAMYVEPGSESGPGDQKWAPGRPCGPRRQAGRSDGALRAPCTSSPDRNLALGTKVGRRQQAGRSDGALRAPCTSIPDRNLAPEASWPFRWRASRAMYVDPGSAPRPDCAGPGPGPGGTRQSLDPPLSTHARTQDRFPALRGEKPRPLQSFTFPQP